MRRRSQVVMAVIVDVDALFDVDHAATVVLLVPALVLAGRMAVVVVVMVVVAVVLGALGEGHGRQENKADQYGGQQALHGSPRFFGWRCDPMAPPAFVSLAMGKH